jgi:predicted SAM-dependent methyltransferase
MANRELLIGCGNRRDKLLYRPGNNAWADLTTLDLDPNSGADVEWDLERMPLPFENDSFDEIHAYHVLEHTGRMGDWRFFFAQWSEFWRLLKPDGLFCGVVPAVSSAWVFADPGHTRVIVPETFTFLDQDEYTRQVGETALADYRHVYRADFAPVFKDVKVGEDGDHQFYFIMQAKKPSRISI